VKSIYRNVKIALPFSSEFLVGTCMEAKCDHEPVQKFTSLELYIQRPLGRSVPNRPGVHRDGRDNAKRTGWSGSCGGL